jgi:hypothetical protein
MNFHPGIFADFNTSKTEAFYSSAHLMSRGKTGSCLECKGIVMICAWNRKSCLAIILDRQPIAVLKFCASAPSDEHKLDLSDLLISGYAFPMRFSL